MSTNSKYAAVGTDGIRPVVWGLGATREDAEEDAIENLAQSGDRSPLVYVSIDDRTAERVEGGWVDADGLGIELSRSKIRELRGE
jgi:hypothetical protein